MTVDLPPIDDLPSLDSGDELPPLIEARRAPVSGPRCRIEGCPTAAIVGCVMCRQHWSMISFELRLKVWREVWARTGETKAIDEAIALVAAKEKR